MYTGFVSAPEWLVNAATQAFSTMSNVEIDNSKYVAELVNIINIKKPVVLAAEIAGGKATTVGTTIRRGDTGLYSIEFRFFAIQMAIFVRCWPEKSNVIRVEILNMG